MSKTVTAIAVVLALVACEKKPNCEVAHARTRTILADVARDKATLNDVDLSVRVAEALGCGRDPDIERTFAAMADHAMHGL